MVIVVSGRCFKEGVAAFTASFNEKLTRSRRRVSAAAIDAGDQVSHPWIYTVEVSRPCPWIKLCVMIWTKICQEPLQQEFQAGRQVGQVVGFLHECCRILGFVTQDTGRHHGGFYTTTLMVMRMLRSLHFPLLIGKLHDYKPSQ